MKIKLLMILALILSANSAFASKLPDEVWNYIKGELPKAVQRFDSVVILDDNTFYIPLYPAKRIIQDKISISYTYPEGKTLKQRPEVVIFNNDYVLMKAVKNQKGNFAITKNENLPQAVKLGVMPQDMLVPVGLEVPEDLRVILGNIIIPKKGDNMVITTSDAVLGKTEDDKGADIVPISYLKDTKTFIANNKNKFLLVYNKGGNEPLYEIKLSSLPSKILASNTTKFALCIYFGSKTAEIIDLTNERVLNKIEFENIPSDADLDTNSQIAYVTSSKANSIYMVDLNSGTLIKTIKLDHGPNKISVSHADKMLVFNDKTEENIYLMDLSKDEYEIKKIANIKNLSKLLIGNGNIAAISRTQNKAYIFRIGNFDSDEPAKLTASLDLAEKPTDAVLYNNKVFILCSKDGIINVYDFEADKMLEPIALDSEGFYSKITIIPNQHNATITGLNTKKIIIIDLETNKLEKKANSNIDVADMVMIDNNAPKRGENEAI